MTTGTFKYIDLDSFTGKPWGKVDVDKTSFSRLERTRSVADMRAAGLDAFSTETSGFGVYNSPAKEKEFTDDDAVRGAYYDEVEALLRKKLPGVSKVVIFDHTIRRRVEGAARQPVQQLHVDQTPWAAEQRVRRHVEDGEEAERLLKGRFQIINVWRPIGHAASDFPLAVVDWRTTKPDDLIKVDLMYPVRGEGDDGDDRGKEILPDASTIDSTEGYAAKGETYAVAPSDAHKFYYVKDMTPEEAMFIKCFDSRSEGLPGGKEGRAAYTPHTAFIDPQTPEGVKGRQSIEVRCLVFYDDEA
ncbi:hypothetical protein ACHAQH_006743 [Verticillium albo-atrum]